MPFFPFFTDSTSTASDAKSTASDADPKTLVGALLCLVFGATALASDGVATKKQFDAATRHRNVLRNVLSCKIDHGNKNLEVVLLEGLGKTSEAATAKIELRGLHVDLIKARIAEARGDPDQTNETMQESLQELGKEISKLQETIQSDLKTETDPARQETLRRLSADLQGMSLN